jgi:hypothetical protein
MSNKTVKSSRKIKTVGNVYEKGDKFLHPISLKIVVAKEDNIIPSELYYDKEREARLYVKQRNSKEYSKFELQKFMALPYINLNPTSFLTVYNIYNFDDLMNYVNNHINKNIPEKNITRIIEMFIKDNIDDLILYNKSLYRLYEPINDKFWKLNFDKENVIKFIDTYIKKTDINDFNYNLTNNLFNYLNKNKN